MSASASQPVVLVVDDEETVADTYALRLQSRYETRTAYGGKEALDEIDDSVDAVLLDRRIPDVHGDEVLESEKTRAELEDSDEYQRLIRIALSHYRIDRPHSGGRRGKQ